MNAVSNRNPPKRSIPSWDLRRRNPRSFRVSGVRQDEGGEDVKKQSLKFLQLEYDCSRNIWHRFGCTLRWSDEQ